MLQGVGVFVFLAKTQKTRQIEPLPATVASKKFVCLWGGFVRTQRSPPGSAPEVRPETARPLSVLSFWSEVLFWRYSFVKFTLTMMTVAAVANKCCRRWYPERIWTWTTTAQLRIWNNLALRYSRRLWCVEVSSVVVHYSSELKDCSLWRDSASTTYLLHCLQSHQGNSSSWTLRRDFMKYMWRRTKQSVIHRK